MSFYTHLHVCFPCDSNEELAAIAKRHLESLPGAEDDSDVYAKMFLKDLSERAGNTPDNTGGLCLWGLVGNHMRPDSFVEHLRPFWEAMLRDDAFEPSTMFPWQRIVVFWECEQSGMAHCYEISLLERDIDGGIAIRGLVINPHALPFRWGH